MRKAIFGMLLLALGGLATTAQAYTLRLVAHNQISGSGAVSTLIFSGANTGTTSGMAVSAMASTATWSWGSAGSNTVSGSGLFQTTSHLGSMATSASVISDVVVDLVIATNLSNPSGAGGATPVVQTPGTTSATTYQCNEGNFLAAVGAHGCGNISLGANALFDSALAYSGANCVTRTIGGDDVSTGDPRGLFTAAAGGGCSAVAGAFDLWTLAVNDDVQGGTIIVSNGVCRVAGSTCGGANWLTFQIVPVPAAVWLFGSALGLLGWVRRRAKLS